MDDDHARAKLGARLREAREAVGLSQAAVAPKVQISRSAISLLETGQRRITALELKRLAQLYKCSVDEILEDL